jgi:flagellar hook-length control protein FliK
MEATTIIPAPSPPNLSGGQTQTSRTSDDTSFAPALSHAVAKAKKSNDTDSEKSSSKSDSAQSGKTSVKDIPPGSAEPKKLNTDKEQEDGAVSSLSDKTTENPTGNDTTSVEKEPETTLSDKAKESAFLLTVGASGCLFTPTEALACSDLQKTISTLANALGTGKQDGFNISQNILGNIADLKKDTSAVPQLKNPLSTDSIQDMAVKDIRSSFGRQLNFDNVSGEKNTILPATGQDRSAATPNIITNTTQAITGTGQDSLLAQQLQKILTANGEGMSVIFQQPTRQNQAVNLNSLSSPLFIVSDSPDQQKTTISDTSNDASTGTLAGAILEKWFTTGRNTDRSSSGLEDDLHGQLLLSKVDPQGQKDTPKVQEKDTTLQGNANQQQSALLNSTSLTGSTDGSQLPGQSSFGGALVQNLQTGQHTAGTTGSNYQLPWTSLQENNLINQVIQNFHINSISSTSKLTLKLYPEELGELKIDIQMKDGGIKANIVAQTEQVQQVLEKYIPKLRSFMEQQGLTVDDILVTTASDDIGRHDLFQKDFADNQDFSSPGKSSKSASLIDLPFDKVFSEKGDTISGVNVTV